MRCRDTLEDLGVFHLRILTRRLLSRCSNKHHILSSMYLGFLSPRIQPLSPRALGAKMNAIASSLSTPSTSRRAGIPEADTPPRNRPLLATPRPSYVETRLRDTERRMMAALELVNLRVSYQTREALARSEAYYRALEVRVAVMETHARRLE
nr:hypothetical protein [Tanacetum cinerariifolium]